MSSEMNLSSILESQASSLMFPFALSIFEINLSSVLFFYFHVDYVSQHTSTSNIPPRDTAKLSNQRHFRFSMVHAGDKNHTQ